MQASTKFNPIHFSLSILLAGYLLLPGFRAIFKYSPYPSLICCLYLIFVSLFLLLLVNGKLEKIQWVIGNPLSISLFLLAVAIACWIAYPFADALKLNMQGSDQDDCIILGTNRILNFSHPYSEKTYFGNPCSPGPGLLLLYAPFVIFHIYILGAISSIAAVVLSLYQKWGDWNIAGLWLIALFSSLVIPELLTVGSDLVLLGNGIAFLAIALPNMVRNKNLTSAIYLSILCGLLASSRINFIVMAPLISLFVFASWRRGGVIFFCLSMLVTFIPSLYIYLLDPAIFTPFHLAGKSTNIAGPQILIFGAILSIGTAIYSALRVRIDTTFIAMGLFISLVPMLLSVSLGDLSNRHWNIAAWDGANYLVPLIPLAALILVTLNTKRRGIKAN